MSSMLNNVVKIYRRGIELNNYPKEFEELIIKPQRVLITHLPIKTSKGLKIFEAYRVQHNNFLGPYKGGIRFYENVTLEDDIALAMIMTLKNSLANLPYGGAKGAIKVNPKELNSEELEKLSREYVRAIRLIIGNEIDIPAPDLGTNSQIMAWMVDELSKIEGYNTFAAFTSKPMDLFGNPIREYSTGYGVAFISKLISEKLLDGIENKAISIHGFGNVGKWAAYWLERFGAKIVSISDSSGTIYDENGLKINEIIKIKEKCGKIIEYKNAKKIEDTNFSLYVNCDILIPASIENIITDKNFNRINAKIIVEGANNPTQQEAELELSKKGITIVPDILANSGGVIASYLEWIQNISWYIWDEEKNKKELEKILKNSFENVYKKFEEENLNNLREAAISIAMERLYKSAKIRGYI
ncbi:MAG: Glu/Leu/Phe/Val dehydrogenase [Candidatus Aenigmatarchaeota archaeon]